MSKLSNKELDALVPTLCTRCGKCCLDADYMGSMSANSEDMARWRKQKRDDILAHAWIFKHGRGHETADLWFKADKTEECYRCPYVRKDRGAPTYSCRIYETRPKICREYPGSYAQMKHIGCEIIDEAAKRGIDLSGWESDDDE